jgi:hypothetical protein
MKLQATTNMINDWAKKWTIKKKNQNNKRILRTFTIRNQTCPTVQMGNVALP